MTNKSKPKSKLNLKLVIGIMILVIALVILLFFIIKHYKDSQITNFEQCAKGKSLTTERPQKCIGPDGTLYIHHLNSDD